MGLEQLYAAYIFAENVMAFASFQRTAGYIIAQGVAWYHLVPVLVIAGLKFNFIYRFLMYRHPKD